MVGDAEDAGLSLQTETRREQLQIIDRLHGVMRNRTSRTMVENDKFGVLTKMKRLTKTSILPSVDTPKLSSTPRAEGMKGDARVVDVKPGATTLNRRDGGQLECALSPSVGGEVGTRDIVPELAHVVQDIPRGHSSSCA